MGIAFNLPFKFCFVIITHQLPQPKLNRHLGIKTDNQHKNPSLFRTNTHSNITGYYYMIDQILDLVKNKDTNL